MCCPSKRSTKPSTAFAIGHHVHFCACFSRHVRGCQDSASDGSWQCACGCACSCMRARVPCTSYSLKSAKPTSTSVIRQSTRQRPAPAAMTHMTPKHAGQDDLSDSQTNIASERHAQACMPRRQRRCKHHCCKGPCRPDAGSFRTQQPAHTTGSAGASPLLVRIHDSVRAATPT